MAMDELQRIKGGACGFAYAAGMYGSSPALTEKERTIYKWAQQYFILLARGEITEEEAILGYGG